MVMAELIAASRRVISQLSTSDQRRQMMSRIKGRDTGPERNLRHSVWAENTQWLEARGLQVLRLWEHEIEASPEDSALRIAAILGKAEESRI